jgi:phosphoribosylglycinamide formyltransferase-1
MAFVSHRRSHLKIAVLISGNGSNLQSIIRAIQKQTLPCSLEYVISDREGAYGLVRAEKNGIRNYVFDRKVLKGKLSDEILRFLRNNVDFMVLAGFLSILNGEILQEYKNRIINIHPSLIPAFCGKGMYGIKVHQSVISSGVKYSGCTVHYVDEGTDTGRIILQKIVKVNTSDTAETLAKKVLIKEHQAIVEALKMLTQEASS